MSILEKTDFISKFHWIVRPPSPRVKPASHYAHVAAHILCDRPCSEPFPSPNVYADPVTKSLVPSTLTTEKELGDLTDYRYGSQYHKRDIFLVEDVSGYRSEMEGGAGRNKTCCGPFYSSNYTKLMQDLYHKEGKQPTWKRCISYTGFGFGQYRRDHRPETAEFATEYEIEYEPEYEPEYEYEYEVELDEHENPKIGPDGKPIRKPKLGPDGKPIMKPKLGADGKQIMKLKLGADGKPIMKPKLGADGRKILKLGHDGLPIIKRDEYGNPIYKRDESGKLIGQTNLQEKQSNVIERDKYGNPIYKRDENGKLIGQSQLQARQTTIIGRDKYGNPIYKRDDTGKFIGRDKYGNPIYKRDDTGKLIGKVKQHDKATSTNEHEFSQMNKKLNKHEALTESEKGLTKAERKAKMLEQRRLVFEENARIREQERQRHETEEKERLAKEEEIRKRESLLRQNAQRKDSKKASFGSRGKENTHAASANANANANANYKEGRKSFNQGKAKLPTVTQSSKSMPGGSMQKFKAKSKRQVGLIGDFNNKRRAQFQSKIGVGKSTTKQLGQGMNLSPNIGYAMVGEIGPIPLGISRRGSKQHLFNEYPGEYEHTMEMMFSHEVLGKHNGTGRHKGAKSGKHVTLSGDGRHKSQFQATKNADRTGTHHKKHRDGIIDILKGIEVQNAKFGALSHNSLPTLQHLSKHQLKGEENKIIGSVTSIKSNVNPSIEKIKQTQLESKPYVEVKLHGKLSKTFQSIHEMTGPTSVKSISHVTITSEESITHHQLPKHEEKSKQSISPKKSIYTNNNLKTYNSKHLNKFENKKSSFSIKSKARSLNKFHKGGANFNNYRNPPQHQQQNTYVAHATPHYPERSHNRVYLPPIGTKSTNGHDDGGAVGDNTSFYALSKLDVDKHKNQVPGGSGSGGSEIGQEHQGDDSNKDINTNWYLASNLFRRPLKAIAVPPPQNILYYIEKKYPENKWPGNEKPVAVRYYPNGDIFCATYTNGSGQVFYPHGGLAIVISAPSPFNHVLVIRDPYDEFYFLDKCILADLDCSGSGVVYGKEGIVLMRYNTVGGYRLDEIDKTSQRWLWNRGGQRLIIKMNRYMSLRVLDLTRMHLVFNGNKRGLRFNVGPGRNISLIYISSILDNEHSMLPYAERIESYTDQFDYRRAKLPTPVLGFFDRCRYPLEENVQQKPSEMGFKYCFEDCDPADLCLLCECTS